MFPPTNILRDNPHHSPRLWAEYNPNRWRESSWLGASGAKLLCYLASGSLVNSVDDKIGAAYLEEALRSLRGHKRLAEGAFAQLRDEELFVQLDDEANSIAI